jgi:hypothetical protein
MGAVEMYFGSKRYIGIRRSEIAELSNEHLVLAVISWLYGVCDADLENEYSLIIQQEKPCQYIYGAVLADDDICNGGFAQYYANRGEFSDIAVEGFIAIGAKKEASILSRANTIYRKVRHSLNSDNRETYGILRLTGGFDVLETEYYRDRDSESFENMCISYIRENLAFFGESSY